MALDLILQNLPQQLVYGITLGSLYALVALGYTMVYGILFMINFAHGDVFMVSSFVAWGIFASLVGSGAFPVNVLTVLPLMLIGAMAVAAALGVSIERIAYRPIYAHGGARLAPMISAMGVSLVLQNMMLLIQVAFLQGPRTRNFPTNLIFPSSWYFTLGNVRVSYLAVTIVVAAILLMLGLENLVQKTRIGKAMRAVCQDREGARMIGVNINFTVMATFFLGSALGGAGGVLIGLYYTQTDLTLGYFLGLKAFTAAVLGGIGSIRGAMLGGLLLGLIEAVSVAFINPAYKDSIAFIVLILLLIVKPSGLLGTTVPQQVRATR